MESNHKLTHSHEIDPEAEGYEYFTIQIDNGTPINVNRHELIKFISGDNTTISNTGKEITITATSVDTGTDYVHPDKTWVDKNNLSGSSVISNITIDAKGHPTGWTIRSITPNDIGAATDNHTHDFDNYTKWSLKVGSTTLDINSNDLLEIISSSSIAASIENGKIILRKTPKVVVNVSGTSVGKVSDHNNKWMNITSSNAVFTVSGTFSKDDEIEGSFTGSGRLTINGSGITLIYSDEYHQNKIPKGGTFALKFISPTEAMLFGRLIPIGI